MNLSIVPKNKNKLKDVYNFDAVLCPVVCSMVVFLLATPVHGLVHVVDPGPDPGRGGARTRAAAPVPAHARAPTRRAPAAARAATRGPAPAPGIEVMGELLSFF